MISKIVLTVSLSALTLFSYAKTVTVQEFEEACKEHIKLGKVRIDYIEADLDYKKAVENFDAVMTSVDENVFNNALNKLRCEEEKPLSVTKVMSLDEASNHLVRKFKLVSQENIIIEAEKVQVGLHLSAPRDYFGKNVPDDQVDWTVTKNALIETSVSFPVKSVDGKREFIIQLKTKEMPLVKNGDSYKVELKDKLECSFVLDDRDSTGSTIWLTK